jgi:tRNA acetyltransferase TAN1
LLDEFNLVVATYRQRENDCISELWYFAREIGDTRFDASKTGLPSLVVARTSLDPEVFASKAYEKILDNPWYFRYILKLTPIHVTVEASLEAITQAALELASKKLGPNETYKVETHIRLSHLTRDEVITAIAGKIQNRVNLDYPDKVILVEVIGDRAGIAVIPPKVVVSVEKTRREARQRQKQRENVEETGDLDLEGF